MNRLSNTLTKVLFLFPALVVAGLVTEATVAAQSYTLKRTFNDPTVTTYDRFGASVALDGNRVLIAASNETNGEDVGQAHLFDTTTGSLLHTFDDPNGTTDNGFNASVALDGDRVLIGAPGHDIDGVSVGQAYLFDATTFNLLHTFDDPTITGRDRFGNSVALDGDRVLIGAFEDNTNGPYVGQAHLFAATSGNLLRNFDDPTVNGVDPFGEQFGSSVALDGDRILIGARSDDTNGINVGQAHLFDARTGNLLQTFDDPTVTDRDGFGWSVALDGNHVLIGAPNDETLGCCVGQAHLFDAISGSLLHTFDDPGPAIGGDAFGRSVALDGNRVLIGAHSDGTIPTDVGQVHLFDATTGNLLHTFNDPTPTGTDSFGFSVALEGTRVLIGAPDDSTHGDLVGQAHLFTLGCDFNADGLIDIEDVDALITEIAAGTNDPTYDLDGNDVVDVADRDEWLTQAGALNLDSGNPYLVTDFDLDGTVDGRDFIIWNANKFSTSHTGKWSLGDANGDGVTDGLDFIAWNQNKFQSADGMAAVPETAAATLLLTLVISLGIIRRRP